MEQLAVVRSTFPDVATPDSLTKAVTQNDVVYSPYIDESTLAGGNTHSSVNASTASLSALPDRHTQTQTQTQTRQTQTQTGCYFSLFFVLISRNV